MITSWLMSGLMVVGQAAQPVGSPARLAPLTIPEVPPPGTIYPVSQVVPPNTTSPFKEKMEAEEMAEEKGDKLFLMKALEGTAFQTRGLSARGYTEANYNISNQTGQTVRKNNLPQAMNYMGNQFMMEQSSITVEKLLDYEKKEFQWGFNLTALAGTDYRFTTSNNARFLTIARPTPTASTR